MFLSRWINYFKTSIRTVTFVNKWGRARCLFSVIVVFTLLRVYFKNEWKDYGPAVLITIDEKLFRWGIYTQGISMEINVTSKPEVYDITRNKINFSSRRIERVGTGSFIQQPLSTNMNCTVCVCILCLRVCGCVWACSWYTYTEKKSFWFIYFYPWGVCMRCGGVGGASIFLETRLVVYGNNSKMYFSLSFYPRARRVIAREKCGLLSPLHRWRRRRRWCVTCTPRGTSSHPYISRNIFQRLPIATDRKFKSYRYNTTTTTTRRGWCK